MFSGFSSAPPLGRTGAPGDGVCTSCHGGNNSNGFMGSLEILGLPAEVTPSTTYRVTVEVANPDGLSARAGMQMVALKSDDTAAGTFTNPSTGGAVTVNTNNGRNYLGHSPAQGYDANRIVTWEVDWTTPAEVDPNVTFYAVGNVANGSGTSGDLIIFETATTEIIDPVMELPDLFASNVNGFSGTFAPDDIVEFTWDLNNNSNVVATESYRVAMYLSDDTQFSANDPFVGEVPTGNTFPGVIPNVPGAIRVPLGTADGAYYLHFLVDADGAVAESDENNNLLTTSTTINVETPTVDPLAANIASTFSCVNGTTLSAVVSGGVEPYAYSWSTGATTPSIMADITQDYLVSVTDDNGTEVVATFSETIPQPLMANVQINEQPSCGTFGSVTLLASGGLSPYQYTWSDGAIGANRDALAAGNYMPTIVDANGCEATVSFVLNANSDIVLTASVTQLTCPDVDDASIAVVASGGSGTYTYSWSNQMTTATIDMLPGGIYTVTVNDGGSCETIQSFSITVLEPIELVSTIEEITCAGDSDGSISVLAFGGTGPYQYSWSNNVTGNTNTDLMAGIYTVTVTDANSCVHEEDFVIREATELEVSLEVRDATCFGAENGMYTIQIVGDDTSIQVADGLAAGTYPVTLTSAEGCTLTESIVVGQPSEILVDGQVEDVLCAGDASGAVSLTMISDGIPPYSFAWSNGFTSLSIVGLVAGTYEVTVTDALECSSVREFVVTEPEALALTADATYAFGDNSTIDIEVSGGVQPYTYQWSNGETTQDISELPQGTYQVAVTDANGCVLMETFDIISTAVQTIEEISSLTLYPTPTQNVLNVEVSFTNAVEISAQIFSLDGRYQESVQASFSQRAGRQTSQMDVSHLDGGIYMLVLKSEAGVVAKRFVKM